MSAIALEYVRNLGPDKVTPVQKSYLMPIADDYSDRYGSANIAMDELSAELGKTPRHLGLVYKSLDHILVYKPGLGKGNFSEFRFLELDRIKVAESQHKVRILATPIRKDLNPDQNQTPPQPPFQGGALTVRERKRLNDEIWRLQELHPQMEFQEAVEMACAALLIPLAQAWSAIEASGTLGEARRKPARKVG